MSIATTPHSGGGRLLLGEIPKRKPRRYRHIVVLKAAQPVQLDPREGAIYSHGSAQSADAVISLPTVGIEACAPMSSELHVFAATARKRAALTDGAAPPGSRSSLAGCTLQPLAAAMRRAKALRCTSLWRNASVAAHGTTAGADAPPAVVPGCRARRGLPAWVLPPNPSLGSAGRPCGPRAASAAAS